MKLLGVVLALPSFFRAGRSFGYIATHVADSAVVEFTGRHYAYWSNDDHNSTIGYIMCSTTCFLTNDLKDWTDHGVVRSRTEINELLF